MKRRYWARLWRYAAIVAMGLLPASCALQLRDGAVNGASNYVADATYGLLASFLNLPLRGGSTGSNGGGSSSDPFTDVPLQM